MAAVVTVTRSRWLGYRWAGHGLAGDCPDRVLDDLLLLGVQDGRQRSAAQSLAQRTHGEGAGAISPTGPLVAIWSVRGAPHVHRAEHLDTVRDALAPQPTGEGGTAYVDAVKEVGAALSAVVSGPTSKAEASGAVAERLPARAQWCERCGADHVPDGLFRAAGRHARLVLGDEEARATVLHPPPDHPQEHLDRPRSALLAAHLRVNGPTTRPLFRDERDSDTATVAGLWKERGDMVRVEVDGRRYDVAEERLDALAHAPDARGVVLVPPQDPYLRQVDRALLVPERERRGEVWRALSGPGALLVDGEVAGTWRYRRAERELTIAPFDGLDRARRAAAERSARLVADAEVKWNF